MTDVRPFPPTTLGRDLDMTGKHRSHTIAAGESGSIARVEVRR